MALRNQPYIPLYVNDFLTDEKLIECSAESTGVYIRLMCLMHKSENYGVITLKDKDKQFENGVENFVLKITRLMPYEKKVIKKSIEELINENVIMIKNDSLIQRRMVQDNSLSIIRSKSGKKGGIANKNKGKFAMAKVQAKQVANTEYEIEYENTYFNNIKLNNIFIEYLKLRKKLKAVNSDTAIKLLINKLNQYDDDIKIKMIENSIQNSWKSVYELKENEKTKSAVPKWFNQKIESEEISEDKKSELEEMLKEFK